MNDLTLAEAILAQTSCATESGVPTRPLGKTGVRVSILGIGGYHIGAIQDEAMALRIMHAAVDEGLTFFDNAWDYHDGRSEELMGKALGMDGRRSKVFLMTKNCERDYEGSMRNLEASLRRLRTDYIDLWQFHEMNYHDDPDWVFDRGGVRAALDASRAGKVRFIGFAGHKDPRIHLDLLSRPIEWDACQMPINVMDVHYRSFQKQVVPACLGMAVGIIGMKGLGGGYRDGVMLANAGLKADECYRYCLSQPISTQIAGITTMEQLRQDLALVRSFRQMTSVETESLLARVRELAADGNFELFKSATEFDAPFHRAQHSLASDDGP